MTQGYHTNAKTNSHSREIIQQSTLTNSELSQRFEITEKTVSKWKNRDYSTDKSSRPHTIKRKRRFFPPGQVTPLTLKA